MYIWKYDETNSDTRLKRIEVDDNHALSDDELIELPEGFNTPAKLVNGKLTGSTDDESRTHADNWLASVGVDVSSIPDSLQKQISDLLMQVAQNQSDTQNSNATVLALIANLQSQINELKGGAQ